jgi:RHS repeat-associated protein
MRSTHHPPSITHNLTALYSFSAKERDTETGLSYFGSRYYNPNLSIWLSVDPMSDKYASLSPYNYCANNPVKLVDPKGEEWCIDGYTYYPGENCPEVATNSTRDKWTTMNEIYQTKNGKTVIDALNGNDCLYYISSDINSDGKGCFSHKDKKIYLNGNDRSVGTLSHEIFHAYQDYNGRSEASIFNEVEANMFSYSVLSQQCTATGECIMFPENSSLLNGRPPENPSEEYKQYHGNVVYLLLGNFNREKFNNVVSGFLKYSKQNATGKYDNGYKQGGDIYEDTLIEKIFK